MNHSDYLSLAGMALQVEFGDFSHDIHDDIYFNLEHYLPSHMIKDDIESLRSSLVKLHKAHLGKTKSILPPKNEVIFQQKLFYFNSASENGLLCLCIISWLGFPDFNAIYK